MRGGGEGMRGEGREGDEEEAVVKIVNLALFYCQDS